MNRRIFFTVILLAISTLSVAQSIQKKPIDKQNLVIKEWITDYITNRKFLDHETIFNSEGKKIEEKEYSKEGLCWTKRYEYLNGRIYRELTYDQHGTLNNIQKIEYNEFGRRKVVYSYNAHGRLIKTKVYDYKFKQHAGK